METPTVRFGITHRDKESFSMQALLRMKRTHRIPCVTIRDHARTGPVCEAASRTDIHGHAAHWTVKGRGRLSCVAYAGKRDRGAVGDIRRIARENLISLSGCRNRLYHRMCLVV
jgi:hypothetical protein